MASRALLLPLGLLAACAAPAAPVMPDAAPPAGSVVERELAGVTETSAPLSTPVAAPFSTANPAPVDMRSPASSGPSRETLCEKALVDLELAAAAPIDKCVGAKPGSNQPITINVRVDESGNIAETKWDVSTSTGYGQKAASCILAAVKALPFAEPACSKEWLLLRRARPQSPGRDVFDSRF